MGGTLRTVRRAGELGRFRAEAAALAETVAKGADALQRAADAGRDDVRYPQGDPTMRAVASIAVLAAVLAVAVVAAGETTATAVVCTSVEDRAPVGAADRFPAGVGRLMCFSEVLGGTGKVVHVWIRGDREVAVIELRAHGERWRTWSEKRILPEWTGAWRVEVRAEDGTVLAKAEFTIE